MWNHAARLEQHEDGGVNCCGRGWYHPVSFALCHINQLFSSSLCSHIQHVNTAMFSRLLLLVHMCVFSPFVWSDSGSWPIKSTCSIPSCSSWFYNHNISKSVSDSWTSVITELNLLMPMTFFNVTSVTFIKIISEIFLMRTSKHMVFATTSLVSTFPS